MIQYEFMSNWGCFDHTHISQGYALIPDNAPNQLVPCAKPVHSEYDQCSANSVACCNFTCNVDYILQNEDCVHKCLNLSDVECKSHQKTITTCQTSTTTFYTCSDCPIVSGSSVEPWTNRVDNSQCEYQTCDAGYFSTKFVCEKCAVGKYSSANASDCKECGYGQTSSLGAQECMQCLHGNMPSDAQCLEGQKRTMDLSETFTYLDTYAPSNTSKISLMHQFCTQNFACLPCPPGTFLTEQNECQACPVGKYQPNFQSAYCYTCNANQTTHYNGSKSEEDCRCEPGFEE